jgi:pyruvate dehydrogenase E2 component (dihydrolipoamide acetyltransferase)
MFGISEFSAVINPPQIGILAVGKSQLKFDANMNVQTIVTFTLSYDERCCNLDRASKFMNTLNYLIANPQLLVDNSSPL